MVLGVWGNRDLAECARIIQRAIDAGINLIDTADVYGAGENELIVGRAIAGRRDDVVLATKFHGSMGDDVNRRGNSRRWVMRAIDESLRRLDVDHVDLYQIHRPDPATPIEETVGPSTTSSAPARSATGGRRRSPPTRSSKRAGQPLDATPPDRTPSSRRTRSSAATSNATSCRCASATASACSSWSPLSGGWLTGKYRAAGDAPEGSRAATNPEHFDGHNEAKAAAVDRLRAVADQAGLPLVHLALAWAAEHPAVSSVLLGPRTDDQLTDLLGAVDVTFEADTLDAIDEIVAPGTDVNPADAGWTPPGLEPDARRR